MSYHNTYNTHTKCPYMWHEEEHQSHGGDAASDNIADWDVCI